MGGGWNTAFALACRALRPSPKRIHGAQGIAYGRAGGAHRKKIMKRFSEISYAAC
ncbi:MAG: hypothetical protein ACRCTI_03160 [Beijerinckiaceae bacterium]